MRLAVRLLRPAANQTGAPGLWQDPVRGYFEQHGKMEFVAGEDYGLNQAQKQAVLDRYRMKEALKKEYARLEFDPATFKYRDGVVMDPAVFRWYAADMTVVEHMRWTPKSALTTLAVLLFTVFVFGKFTNVARESSDEACREGKILWWERTAGRLFTTTGCSHSGIDVIAPF